MCNLMPLNLRIEMFINELKNYNNNRGLLMVLYHEITIENIWFMLFLYVAVW